MLRVSVQDALNAQQLGQTLERNWANHEAPTLQVRLNGAHLPATAADDALPEAE